MKRALLGILALVVAAGAAYAVFGVGDDGPPRASRIERVTRGSMTEFAGATGTIEPNVQIEIRSRASGEVLEILAQEGDHVEAGQPLIRLDPADSDRSVAGAEADLRRARAGLREARAALAIAQAEAARSGHTRDLDARGQEMGLVATEAARGSAHASDVATRQLELRRAQVQAAAASVETARLAVDDAQRRRAETELMAPFAGTVLDVAVERGSLVVSAIDTASGGATVMTLADLAHLRIVGQVDEAQIRRIEVGQRVDIRVDAYPGRIFEGRVARVSPLGQGDDGVVTFDVEIEITDEGASDLRSGMSADVEIVIATHEDVLLIPLMAVRSHGDEHTVYTADGQPRNIDTGATNGSQVVVESGLEEGQEISAEPLAQEAPPSSGGLFSRRRRRR